MDELAGYAQVHSGRYNQGVVRRLQCAQHQWLMLRPPDLHQHRSHHCPLKIGIKLRVVFPACNQGDPIVVLMLEHRKVAGQDVLDLAHLIDVPEAKSLNDDFVSP